MGGGVDDDVGGERAEQLEDLHQGGRRDLVGEGRLGRGREHVEAAAFVAHEQALEELGVEPVDVRDGVDDRVLRRQLEHDGHVAELQVGVDQHDGALGALARTTARLQAMTDLPEPPLVENTVMSRQG